MLQIFILFFILFHPITVITTPDVPKALKKPCLTFLILNAPNILTEKFKIQSDENLPKATPISIMISVTAEPYTKKEPHAYDPTACRNYITRAVKEHLLHR